MKIHANAPLGPKGRERMVGEDSTRRPIDQILIYRPGRFERGTGRPRAPPSSAQAGAGRPRATGNAAAGGELFSLADGV